MSSRLKASLARFAPRLSPLAASADPFEAPSGSLVVPRRYTQQNNIGCTVQGGGGSTSVSASATATPPPPKPQFLWKTSGANSSASHTSLMQALPRDTQLVVPLYRG